MESSFDINSYVGVGDLKFGMNPDQVSHILGPAQRTVKNRVGALEEYREGIKVCYSRSECLATDFVLFLPAEAKYRGTDLLRVADPVMYLSQYDPLPLEGMGIIVFLQLGLTLSDCTDPKSADSSVTAFALGRWDSLKEKLKPLQTGKN